MKRAALISVFYKTGIVDLAQAFVRHDITILSTGGTAETIRKAGIVVMDVAEYTGFPEMMGGRLKTLYPTVHGGILGRPEDVAVMEERGMFSIDFVVVNLYPFEETIARPECTFAEAIEQIDIGGPTMLRAAAKNHARVTALCDPDDYGLVISLLDSDHGHIKAKVRKALATIAFGQTAKYDAAITQYLRVNSSE